MKSLLVAAAVAALVCLALADTQFHTTSSDRLPLLGDLIRDHPEANVTQHFGYINVNKQHDANLFFWLFESQNDPSSDPLVLWLTGGPGCSSLLALFFENGPYTVSSGGNLVVNPYSWNKNATVMWVDQPVGTGFSYANTDYIHNEAQVSQEMAAFLTAFFQQYPQYASLDFFVTGESYGGHYVPAVASYIVQNEPSINFKGAAIGDGWISPIVQYGAYGPFAYQNNLITEEQYSSMNSSYVKCKALLEKQEWQSAFFICSGIMEVVLNNNPGINVYNIDTQCNPPPLCYNLDPITNYLNDPSVQQHLGVKNIDWEACNDEVNGNFVPIDEEESYSSDIPIILGAGHPVMLYNGKLDLICNYVGGLQLLEAMSWSQEQNWNDQSFSSWTVKGQTAGQIKSYANLTYVQVEQAGHMVPHDQGENALSLINSFIYGIPFSN